MKTVTDQPQTLTKDLRANLKSLVEKELNQLPETLAALAPEKRLEVLLKLLPFVLPKVESVAMTKGEPTSWELN